MVDNPVREICERVAEVQALLDDHLAGSKHTAADVVAKAQVVLSESALTGTQADAQNRTDTLTKADRLAPPSLGAPVPQPPAQKKINNDTEVNSEQAALVNVMKAAIAARHGGVLPKTLSDEDAKAASQAAIKWRAKQAA